MRRYGFSPWALLLAAAAAGAAEPPATPPVPPALALDEAVRFALAHNPALAALREQRGLAAAGVVLARTYPYNPVYNGAVLAVRGEDVGNHVFNEHSVTLQLEVRGQGKQRRAAAAAALTRAEWEIAAQEVATAVAVIRAYDTVVYRQQKLQVLEET